MKGQKERAREKKEEREKERCITKRNGGKDKFEEQEMENKETK